MMDVLIGGAVGAFIGAMLFWFVYGVTGWTLVLPGGGFALVGAAYAGWSA